MCIFEDDAYPRDGIANLLDYYLSDIPSDCGIMLLGYYRLFQFMKHDEKFFNHATIWGSHSYIVFKNAYDKYLSFLDSIKVADSW